jgi:hypothetical protein
MAALTVQQLSLAGVVTTTAAAASGGDTFVNNGKTWVRVVNGSGSPITVTANSLVNCNMGHDHDIAVSVGAGATKEIGPFPMDRFNSSAGAVSLTYSAVTDVTVGAISI